MSPLTADVLMSHSQVLVTYGEEQWTYPGHRLFEEMPLLWALAERLSVGQSKAISTFSGTPLTIKRVS